VKFHNNLFVVRRGIINTLANTQAGGAPLVFSRRLLPQHIRNYPPHVEAFSCNRNQKTRHAAVTGLK
jgi:hypothetical protein